MIRALTRYGIPAMLLVGLAFVVFALFDASRQPSSANNLKRFAKGEMSKLEFGVGNSMPLDRFENADGDRVTLQDIDAKVIVLNLWFEACPPCEEEMPSLGALQTALADENVKVVAIALDRANNREGNREALADWTDGVLEFYFDHSFGMAYATKSRGMPTTIIYDQYGQEQARLSGAADWASEEAILLIREIASR